MKRANVSRKLTLFFLTAALLIISNCGGSIDEDKAVKIYVESAIAEEQFSYSADSVKSRKGKILKKYQTTRQDYEAYLKNLEYDEEKWASFFKRADEYLTDLKKSEAIK
ncbi:MAG: hypothetical protein HYS25_13100 [Ignavibacteriales bacterium]|nr:hypothetical protein [Ignavibacteriales bacterium]